MSQRSVDVQSVINHLKVMLAEQAVEIATLRAALEADDAAAQAAPETVPVEEPARP